jgi:hypothetical protein
MFEGVEWDRSLDLSVECSLSSVAAQLPATLRSLPSVRCCENSNTGTGNATSILCPLSQ